MSIFVFYCVLTDKKESQIFLIYKVIQSGAVEKSYMRKGFRIYEEMRKYFPINERPLVHVSTVHVEEVNKRCFL
jgi:hypothetical protein